MKWIAFAISVAGSAALIVTAVVTLILTDSLALGAIVPATLALLLLALSGPVVGAFLALGARSPEQGSDQRFRHILRWVAIAGCGTAAAILAVLASAGLIPSLLAGVFVAAGTAWAALHYFGGMALARREDEQPRTGGPRLVPDAAYTRRKLRTIAITVPCVFAGLSIVAVIALPEEESLVFTLLFALFLACLTGAILAFPAVSGFADRMREVVGGDNLAKRKLKKVVVRGKDIDLSDDEKAMASHWAPLAMHAQVWTAVQIGLLYAALAAQNLGTAFGSNEFRSFNFWLVIALLAFSLAMTPLLIVNYRRTSRYAREHPPQHTQTLD